MRDVLTNDGVMADEEGLSRCKISRDIVCNMLKTYKKYAHVARGRPTLKDVESFRKGRSANLMRDLFMSEHL